MSDASKLIYPSDSISPAVCEAVYDYNTSGYAPITCIWETVPPALLSSGKFRILTFAPDQDVVIEDVLFNCEATIQAAATHIGFFNYQAFDYATPTGPNNVFEKKAYMIGFNSDPINAGTMRSMKSYRSNIKEGNFPFVLPKGQMLVGNVRNKEAGAISINPRMQVIVSTIKDN